MKKSAFYTLGSIVILIICFIAFVLPSTGLRSTNSNSPLFGKYKDKKIAYEIGSDFNNHVGRISRNYSNYGLDPNQYSYSIFSSAFTETVRQYVSEDAVKASNYKVSAEEVNRIIRSLPEFQKDGKFSTVLYNKADKKAVQDYKNEIENGLFIGRYEEDLLGSSTSFGNTKLFGTKISDAETKFLQSYADEKRGFDMISFNLSDYPKEEKVKYGEQNAAKFNKFDLAVITCEEQKVADEVASRLANNEITFEDAVTEYSTQRLSDTEGSLNNSFQYQIENILVNKEQLSEIVDLSVDSLSSVIETSTGFAIFKKKSANVAPDFTDDELISKVSSYIIGYESSIIEDYFTAKAKDFNAAVLESDFNAACEKFGLTKSTIEPFPLNFGSVSIADSLDTSLPNLSNADQNENFLKTAFSLKMNECSEPLVMNNAVVVIQYTNNVESEEADRDAEAIADQIATMNMQTSDSALLLNSKLKNNFTNTYFNEFQKGF